MDWTICRGTQHAMVAYVREQTYSAQVRKVASDGSVRGGGRQRAWEGGGPMWGVLLTDIDRRGRHTSHQVWVFCQPAVFVHRVERREESWTWGPIGREVPGGSHPGGAAELAGASTRVSIIGGGRQRSGSTDAAMHPLEGQVFLDGGGAAPVEALGIWVEREELGERQPLIKSEPVLSAARAYAVRHALEQNVLHMIEAATASIFARDRERLCARLTVGQQLEVPVHLGCCLKGRVEDDADLMRAEAVLCTAHEQIRTDA